VTVNNLGADPRKKFLIGLFLTALVLGFVVVLMRMVDGGGDEVATDEPSGYESSPGAPSGEPAEEPALGEGASAEPEKGIADLLPYSEDEVAEAAGVAKEFAEVYNGTGKDREDRISELATRSLAESIPPRSEVPEHQRTDDSAGGGADGGGAGGEAKVLAVTAVTTNGVTVSVRPNYKAAENNDGAVTYAVMLVERDGAWSVSDVQNAAALENGTSG
jgi:hypothetical protein